jgi:hypothetical protein
MMPIEADIATGSLLIGDRRELEKKSDLDRSNFRVAMDAIRMVVSTQLSDKPVISAQLC